MDNIPVAGACARWQINCEEACAPCSGPPCCLYKGTCCVINCGLCLVTTPVSCLFTCIGMCLSVEGCMACTVKVKTCSQGLSCQNPCYAWAVQEGEASANAAPSAHPKLKKQNSLTALSIIAPEGMRTSHMSWSMGSVTPMPRALTSHSRKGAGRPAGEHHRIFLLPKQPAGTGAGDSCSCCSTIHLCKATAPSILLRHLAIMQLGV